MSFMFEVYYQAPVDLKKEEEIIELSRVLAVRLISVRRPRERTRRPFA